jgi:hypothetical protein
LAITSDMPDPSVRPLDYAGLRAEVDSLAEDFIPVIGKFWPRVDDCKYRWELHSYGLPDGPNKRVVEEIVTLLNQVLRGIGGADNRLLDAHSAAAHYVTGD